MPIKTLISAFNHVSSLRAERLGPLCIFGTETVNGVSAPVHGRLNKAQDQAN